MTPRSLKVASLLFFSGLCALVYQVAWLRELRLVFGASTPASAAVLAVFMGGLGYGSLMLGKRAEQAARPLRFYADLELGIATLSALTPLLLYLVRALYVVLGGSVTLGPVGGTLVRLVFSALVLLPPTLLMGGTLPGAARAAIGGADAGRRSTALLYGLNTLGAVTGAASSTFILLEVFGTRLTLWLGCLVNALVGLTARALDRRFATEEQRPAPRAEQAGAPDEQEDLPGEDAPARDDEGSPDGDDAAAAPAAALPPAEASPRLRRFVLVAAAGTGFVFLLMELVWYRMLAPLLGGSSYTFGLILAVALAGIGLGGLGYTLRSAAAPARLGGFALSCGLEALLLAVPYALGDRVAWLAVFLRTMGSVGLWGHVVAWTVVTSVVVLPAALVAGYQFPLLIALLGRGGAGLGRQVGLTYACNTAGSIVGSLGGGFLLLPLVGALGTWQLTVWVLALLGLGAALLPSGEGGTRRTVVLGPLLTAVPALALVHLALGPTALWRHAPIGAGRADSMAQGATRTSMKREQHERNRAIRWQTDGRESSIGLHTLNDTAFFVNGKSDGAATTDAGTQVMGGMLGALLHRSGVRSALVIGLGSGSTAGWLGQLPTVERVDVVELEPAMLHVARVCAPVNANVLDNPKVHVLVGDAREVLLSTPRRYDLIFSEPSNPYRAGIASLFTEEFYQAVRDRLEPGGMLVQWVQAYEIDTKSVRTIYATLAAVFPSVESWRTKLNDLVLVSRLADVPIDYPELRARVAQAPFADALLKAWRVRSVAGVLARFVARPSLARAVAASEGELGVNTDDRNLLEFSMARALGQEHDFRVEALLMAAHERGEARPEFVGDGARQVSWTDVYDAMIAMGVSEHGPVESPPHVELSPAMQRRSLALAAWRSDRMDAVVTDWESQPKPPTDPVELTVMADAYAVQAAAAKAEPLIEALRAVSTIEADAVAARLAWAQGRPRDSWRLLRRALVASRTDPWANALLMARVLPLAPAVAEGNADLYADVMEVLGHDLAVSLLRIQREGTRFSLAVSQRKPDCVDALAAIGPWVPWEEYFLRQRASCYELAGDGRLAAARADLEALLADGGMSFGAGIEPPGPQPNVKIDEPMLPPAATSTGPAPATAPGASSAASGVGGAAP